MSKPEWYVACKRYNSVADVARFITRDNVNVLRYKGWTPLFRAVSWWRYDIVRWMLIVLHADASGTTPRNRYGHYSEAPFVQLLASSCVDLIPYLKRSGAYIDALDTQDERMPRNSHMTMLAYGIEYGLSREFSMALIKYGAKLSNVHAIVEIPQWARDAAAEVERFREVALIVLSLSTCYMDKHVKRIVAECFWEARLCKK